MKPNYEKILLELKKEGYIFLNFKNYDIKKKMNSLPEKIILLRHDVHYRDIQNAYKMINLEKKIFGKNVATYFVQLNFYGTTDYEEKYEKKHNKEYEDFIKYCLLNEIHIEPHISLFANIYYNRNTINGPDGEYLKKYCCKDCYTFNKLFFNISKNKKTLLNFSSIGSSSHIIDEKEIKNENIMESETNFEIINDVLNINECINNTNKQINKMEKDWYKLTNKYPIVYSVHGESSHYKNFINPNIFGMIKQLNFTQANDTEWLGSPSDNYTSDNSILEYFQDYKIKNNPPKKFQYLAHPFMFEI